MKINLVNNENLNVAIHPFSDANGNVKEHQTIKSGQSFDFSAEWGVRVVVSPNPFTDKSNLKFEYSCSACTPGEDDPYEEEGEEGEGPSVPLDP